MSTDLVKSRLEEQSNHQCMDWWGDNNPKSPGKGHPFLTHKIYNKIDIRRWGRLKAHIQTIISNWLRKNSSQCPIYTLNGEGHSIHT